MEPDSYCLCHLDESFAHTLLDETGTQFGTFDDLDALKDYLCGDYLELIAHAGELDEDKKEAAKARFEAVCESTDHPEVLMDELNHLTGGLRRILWLGTWRALMEEGHPFAEALRRYFWEEEGGDDWTAPIPEDALDDLAAVLDDFLVDGDYRGL
ncbi:hypothetical protein [Gallaecimonas sp. GXIMD4217]|uniref:hypothetical protein n=1 Tax=Gallaecimonas sp. GXIMD4217 TaxID=3131927 RepID=UPI00311AF45A